MSLLTKEQQQMLEKIRSARTSGGCDFEEYEDIEGTKDFERLFAIIDDLQARAPRETAEPDKDLPQEMHGYPFNMSLAYFAEQCKRHVLHPDGVDFSLVFEYIIERCSRAESRAPQPLATEQADKAMKDEAVRLLSRRQYTEQELRHKFESQFIIWEPPKDKPDWLARVEGAEYIHPHINSEFVGWLDCARHVGALKAEP